MLMFTIGVAGVGASIALADEGHGEHSSTNGCEHARVSGNVSAPQSFTVTVTRGSEHSNLTAGQTVTVVLGATGQTLRFQGEGCVGTDGALTIREAELHGEHAHGGSGGETTTNAAPTTSTTSATTTTTSH
jgi:hypothetical protein